MTNIKDLIRDYAFKTLVEDIMGENLTDEQIEDAELELESLMETIKTYFD